MENNSGSTKFKESVFDGITYIAPSWNELGFLAFDLACKIEKTGKSYDLIIALAKGGWTWARTLVDYLGMDDLASVRIKFYNDVGETRTEPEIVQPLTVPVNRKNILIFDEVADSGRTAEKAKEYVRAAGAQSVDFAVLCYKPRSAIIPEYYSFQTEAWVIFPHEIREAVTQIGGKWLKAGLAQNEIIERCTELGLPENQVRYYLAKITL